MFDVTILTSDQPFSNVSLNLLNFTEIFSLETDAYREEIELKILLRLDRL
jgi:hypothetical protein